MRIALLLTLSVSHVVFVHSSFAENIEGRLKKLTDALKRYESTLAPTELFSDELFALTRLKIEKAQILFENYQPNKALTEEIKIAEKLVTALGKVREPLPLKPGLHELAYIAQNDLSAQPYLLYLPKNWVPERPFPLFIFLHGYASYLDKVNWIDLMYSPDLEALMDKVGFILLMPFGRSNTEFMGIGEADVLHTIDLVRQRCKIDEDRIFISGASMGGSGAYTIAAHYPHLFAGVAVIAGRYDYYLWKNIDPDKLSGFKRMQMDMDYIRALLPNLRNVHTFIFHGSADALVQPEQSRSLARSLAGLGFRVTYQEFPDESHWIWGLCFSHPPFAKWLEVIRRDPNPRIVEYKTYSPKYNRAHWVTINEIERFGEASWLQAEAKGGNLIVVDTTNIASLTLTLNERLADLSRPVTVLWNGKEQKLAPSADGVVSLLAPRSTLDSPRFTKSPDLCGPIREFFINRFLIVYGTGGDEQTRRTNTDTAVQAAQEWIRFSAGRAHLRADDKVSETDLKENNLFLFGTSADNAIIKKLHDSLPIKREGDSYVVGERRFPATGTGLLLLYPSPFATGRYVLICSGPLWGEHLSINHKWDFLPDFIIYTREKDWDDNNKYLCAGYFDKFWQLDNTLIWLGKDEKDAQIVK